VSYLQNGSLFKEIISPGVFVAGLSSLNARATLCLERVSRRVSRPFIVRARLEICAIRECVRALCIHIEEARRALISLCGCVRSEERNEIKSRLCCERPGSSSLLRFCGCTSARLALMCLSGGPKSERAHTLADFAQ
jgi:hypothetical protein